MFYSLLLPMDLRLFDGDGAAAGDAGGQTGDTQQAPKATQRGKPGDLSAVVYGKQEPAAEAKQTDVSTTSDTLEADRREYQDAIRGRWKDFYTQDTQRMINTRFRETKGLQEYQNSVQPLVDMLASKYNVDSKDPAKIIKALEDDNTYWESAAEEAGYDDVNVYKEVQRLKRENAAFQKAAQQQRGQQAAQQQLSEWYAQAEELKKIYPSFNLEKEAQSAQFMSMLRARVPVKQAYEVLHLDEIQRQTAGTAAATAEKRVTENIRARGTRPRENGASGQGNPIQVRSDPSKYTRADVLEIFKRAGRGDKIQF